MNINELLVAKIAAFDWLSEKEHVLTHNFQGECVLTLNSRERSTEIYVEETLLACVKRAMEAESE